MEITSSNGVRPASISPYMLMDEIHKDDGDDGDMDDHSMHASSCERHQNSLQRRLGKRRDVLISSLGSFSTAYNIVNISLSMVSMNLIYPLSDEMKSLSASTMFAGMVAGQLGFGFVGDAIGLVRAFHLTMLLQVVGALASALVYGPHLYVILAMARFFLGIGAGGVYPLSAAVASNSSQKGTSDVIVALVFSLQGVAFVTMNAFATILAYVTDNDQVIFRLLLGMGALPGLLILLIELMGTRMGRDVHASAPGAQKASHMLSEAMSDPLTIKRLTGCSLTWFLYDVCFFGNTLFQPIIGDSVLGGDGSLRSECAESLIISLIALPGYFIAVVFINRLGPRLIQTQGFVICAALYTVLAITGQRLINNGLGSIALTLYGLSFTFFNFGPGCTTFLFPSKLFPREIKSSLNGVAAAAGKIGGFLGGYFFPALLAQFGLNVVLVICCIIALIGAVVTLATLDNQGPSLHHHHIAEGEDDEVREKDLDQFDSRSSSMMINPIAAASSVGGGEGRDPV